MWLAQPRRPCKRSSHIFPIQRQGSSSVSHTGIWLYSQILLHHCNPVTVPDSSSRDAPPKAEHNL